MEDKKVKEDLSKIPDVDEHGEPIYKIDGEETGEPTPENPLFLEDNPDAPKGNKQDIKSGGSEE